MMDKILITAKFCLVNFILIISNFGDNHTITTHQLQSFADC